MSSRALVTAVMCVATLQSGTAHALDGTRKGFIIGLGVGPGVTSFTQEVNSTTSDRVSKFTLVTDFRIGGGVSRKFMLYYDNRVSWFGLDNALGNTVTIAHVIGLLGASYYLEDTDPALYVLGSIGVSTWSAPFESDTDTWSGFGISGGIGYEFAKHWTIEGTLNWGNPSHSSGSASTTALSFLVTMNVLAY